MPVDYHAWTHLPKEEGGTDPIPGRYPYIFRLMEDPQAIGAGIPEYITWLSTDITQSHNHFSSSDPVSIEIITPGVYDFFAGVRWEPFNAVATIRIECQQFEFMPTTYGKGGLYTSGGSLILEVRKSPSSWRTSTARARTPTPPSFA
jgi:hypothetical protein